MIAWLWLGDAKGGVVRVLGTAGTTAVIAVILLIAKTLTIPAKVHKEALDSIDVLNAEVAALRSAQSARELRLSAW